MAPAATPPAERDADSLSPGQVVGRYEIVRRVAVGGMAEIFLARATGLHGFEKQVVIKRILPHHTFNRDFVSMFLDEARIAATLHHPNIAQVYDIGEDSVSFFFAMEYVAGKDLRDLLKANRRARTTVPLKFAVSMLLGAAAGLHAAHEKRDARGRPLNIVHRDASPSNILVGFDGSVKLIDFGIVKAEGRQTATATGIVKGKYAYMSPEQCRGDQLDRRSDIFTLGIVLFELTTGRRLFATSNEYQTMRKILKDPLPRPSELVRGYPPELERIVLRALSRNRDERYQTMQELFSELSEFAQANRLLVSQYDLAAYMSLMFPDDAPDEVPMLRGDSTSDANGERRTLVGVGAPEDEEGTGEGAALPAPPMARGSSPTGHRLESAAVTDPDGPPSGLVPRPGGRRIGSRFSTQEPTIDLGSEFASARIAKATGGAAPASRPTIPMKKIKRGAVNIASSSPSGPSGPSGEWASLSASPSGLVTSPAVDAVRDDGALGSVSKKELAAMIADLDAVTPPATKKPVIRKLTARPVRVPHTVASIPDADATWATPVRIALVAAIIGLVTVGGWVYVTGDWSTAPTGARKPHRGPIVPTALRPLESGRLRPVAPGPDAVAAPSGSDHAAGDDDEPRRPTRTRSAARVNSEPVAAREDRPSPDTADDRVGPEPDAAGDAAGDADDERRRARRRARRQAARDANASKATSGDVRNPLDELEGPVEIFEDDDDPVGSTGTALD